VLALRTGVLTETDLLVYLGGIQDFGAKAQVLN
jgi:hypothetical protein